MDSTNTNTLINSTQVNSAHGSNAQGQNAPDDGSKPNALKGNLAMTVSKTFSGLNENALKYLLPLWMNAYTGVVLRLVFGSVFFWIVGFFTRKTSPKSSTRDKLLLLLTGMIFVFGYMYTLLIGLTYTTPISSSMFISLQPACVYIICLFLRTEKVSFGRIVGIVIGVGAALICIMTQHQSDVASNPALGNLFCAGSTIMFSSYLVIEKRFLRRLSSATVSKWSFTGGLIVAVIVVLASHLWHAPVLSQNIFSTPFLVLAFVLLFPTSLSYLLQDVGLKNLPATVVSLYANLILIVAAIASYILGQDKFSWWQILSIILMIGSVLLVEKAENKAPTKN